MLLSDIGMQQAKAKTAAYILLWTKNFLTKFKTMLRSNLISNPSEGSHTDHSKLCELSFNLLRLVCMNINNKLDLSSMNREDTHDTPGTFPSADNN